MRGFSNFTKANISSWVFFTLFKLYKWYEIAQLTTSEIFLFSPSTQEHSESARETARIICECVNNLLTDLDAGLCILKYSSSIISRGEN